MLQLGSGFWHVCSGHQHCHMGRTHTLHTHPCILLAVFGVPLTMNDITSRTGLLLCAFCECRQHFVILQAFRHYCIVNALSLNSSPFVMRYHVHLPMPCVKAAHYLTQATNVKAMDEKNSLHFIMQCKCVHMVAQYTVL